MPVITRNQKKNVNNSVHEESVKKTTMNQHSSSQELINKIEREFIDIIKKLCKQCEEAEIKSDKLEICRNIFVEFNNKFHSLITNLHDESKILTWVKFVATTFNKTTEFNTQYMIGGYDSINKEKVADFMDECSKARKYATELIKSYDLKLGAHHQCVHFNKAKAEIARLENSRPRRNIKRVNYTGMDTIEPESEFDGITDIWADETIECDPDYVPSDDDEEDEEDDDDYEEEDDDDYEEDVKLTQTEKAELKEHLVQLVENHRIRRNVERVNYAGMDMTEEDVGQIHICKRKFENGKVKYVWQKYSLSKANEIGDEDYQEE